MRTQIIHLDPHDDLISIRDRMAWAKTPRILLVWPARGRVDVRPLDLALLRRNAESLGAQLGIVTRNAEIRAAAGAVGVSVFRKTVDAQKKPWLEPQSARPQRRFARLNLRALRAALPAPELFNFSTQPIARVAVFALGVLAALIVALVFIPSAEIRVSPPAQLQSLTIAVSAEADARQVQISGLIPAREITLIVESTEAKAASGRAVFPDKRATGMVRFVNLTQSSLLVPAKTVVLTRSNTPIRFETLRPVEVPAGNAQGADVTVRALTPGTAGNVPAGALVAFEGPLGLSLTATNPSHTSDGADTTRFIPTPADRQALRERQLANLAEQAKTQIKTQLQAGDVYFPATFTLTKVLDESYAPPADQPGDKLTLTLRAEFRAAYASAADLEQLARMALDASIPADAEALAKTLRVQPVSALFGGAQGITRWQVRAERQVRPRVDAAQIIALVQGKTVQRAGSLIQQMFSLEAPPEINIRPFFWPWLPPLPFRITVTN